LARFSRRVFLFRFAFLKCFLFLDDQPVAHHPHAATARALRRRKDFAFVSGARRALRFTFEFSNTALRFALNFQTLRTVLDRRHQLARSLFEFADRLFESAREQILSLAFPPLRLLVERRKLLRDRNSFLFERGTQTLGF